MSDDAFKDLMGRMHSAVSSSKTAHEHIKKASVAELDEPGDILANTIYGMNDEIRRKSFPEELAKEAEDLSDDDDLDDFKLAEEYSTDDAEVTVVGGTAKKEKKNFSDYAFKKKEAGFGLGVEEDLANPFVALGFNAELTEHNSVIKQAVAKIVQTSAASL